MAKPTFRTLWGEEIAILNGFAEEAQYLGVDRVQDE
jgi:hypothetical protein